MNVQAALKAYLERVGFPAPVLDELAPAIDGLSERSVKLLGSYMTKRARYNLLNHGVSEAALKAFKDDRPRVEAAEAAKKDSPKDEGPRANDDGQYELRISGALVSDRELQGESPEAAVAGPATVQDFLDTLPQGAPVLVLLNSPGGDVHAASEMASLLDAWGGPVTVRVTGLAASAGALLALDAADRIECVSGGKWMFHRASVAGLDYDALLSMADVLDKTDRRQGKLLAAGSSLTEEEAWAAVSEGSDRWYDAEEAAEIGLSEAEAPKPERREGMSAQAKREALLSRELMMLA